MTTIDSFRGEFYFLSNFSACVLEYQGITYPTTEHAYQASKTMDHDCRVLISKLATPGQSKKAGKIVDIRPDWHEIKFQVMEDILQIKFNQPNLKVKLLETGDVELVEGNWWHDNDWGNCTCEKCLDIVGQNNLGKILMKIRNQIINN